jgi:hypothetical protein
MDHDEAAETTGKPFFYQYRPINDRLIENLSKNQIFFNDPNEFNDPFDSMYDIYFEGDKQQFIDHFERNNCPNITSICEINGEAIETCRCSPETILTDMVKNGKITQEGGLYKSTKKWEEQMDEIKLPTACFSVNCRNILLWSHYANYHQGVCLIYKSEGDDYKIKLGTQWARFQHVSYDKDNNVPTRKNMLKEEEKNKVIDFVLTKASCWGYEEEYRIILRDAEKKCKIEKYEKEHLAGIIFGLKVNFCDAHRVYKTIVDNYGKDFKFFEAVQEVVKENAREDVKKYAIKAKKIPNINEYLLLLREKHNKI